MIHLPLSIETKILWSNNPEDFSYKANPGGISGIHKEI
ncbi:hypothetical protein C1752_02717 [Acaryochloris thomasi RCC1774]|uniref:Uncharacterized protein n=1 Tax=Acaryochloris thomasi RCC1774 TaxID=1764569 RepID=A0A2W1JI31_9CYAN|nr:hypothetical protein C1752_02717 [Acaryochloris thomasi RCC1774]